MQVFAQFLAPGTRGMVAAVLADDAAAPLAFLGDSGCTGYDQSRVAAQTLKDLRKWARPAQDEQKPGKI